MSRSSVFVRARSGPARSGPVRSGPVRSGPVRSGLAGTALATALAFLLTGCATSAPRTTGAGTSGQIRVVAAENVWGSIAAQLGGAKVSVTSIVDNPATDPHDYEPTARDGKAFAAAQLVIVNGIGYDPWATKLVAADAVTGQLVETVGTVVGQPSDGNPHRWYSPADVSTMIARITADYQRIDPADAALFADRQKTFDQASLGDYHALIAQVRRSFAGTAVGASESIFAPLATGLGLDLITPPGFLAAVSEGTDPTAADKAAIDEQIADHKIRIYVYNSQNATPDVRSQVAAARGQGIPVVTVTETLTPIGATFQDWQVRQLRDILAALAASATVS